MKRRVAIITEIIAPYRIPVFNALAEREDIDLIVIFLAETDSTQRQWRIYKDEIRFTYEVLPSWSRRFKKQYLLLNTGMRGALARIAPDVIVCGGYNYLASWQALNWARRRHVPFLLWSESTARDLRSENPLQERLKSLFLAHCEGFVVPGKSAFEHLRSCGARDQVIFTAPNAVDTELFGRKTEHVRNAERPQREALNLPASFFLFVGRLVREKGVFDLLDAYAALPSNVRRSFAVVYVGDGDMRPELARRAGKISPGSVQIAGFAQRDQLVAYYALADALVFPTHTDPWGLVVNEAMACGLPVVSTLEAGCTADLVSDRWNGRVVPARRSDDLNAAMVELAEDRALRISMGQNSKERIKQYSPEAWASGVAKAVLSQRIA